MYMYDLTRVSQLLQGFSLDFVELREYTHGTFCDVADLLKEDFLPYLELAVRFALATMAQVSSMSLLFPSVISGRCMFCALRLNQSTGLMLIRRSTLIVHAFSSQLRFVSWPA